MLHSEDSHGDEADIPPAVSGPTKRRRSSSRVSSGGEKRRARASLACMHCRQRKIKCSMGLANEPCASCRSLGIPCVMSSDGDRRKAGSREQVSALQDRLQHLESLMAHQQQQNDASRDRLSVRLTVNRPDEVDNDSDPYHACSTDLAPFGEFDLAPGPHDESRPARFQDSRSQALPDGITMYSASEPPRMPTQGGQPFALEDTIDQHQITTLTPPSEKGSPRLDADGDSSQLRFYGRTTQRYIHSKELPSEDDWSATLGQPGANVNMDSGPVKKLLFQTFWKSQPLSQALVEQHTFERAQSNLVRSEYYSQFLEDSLLACATRMSTSSGIRALGAKYADRATTRIGQELQEPNIATLQGFLSLSDFEATRGRDRLGYMYCGIGCRMVFDLGLHENCDDLIARGKLLHSEALSRYMLFLGSYCYDRLWSLYLGRPSVIPKATLISAQRRVAEKAWSIPETLDAWVGLCTDMSEATEILNGDAPLDWHAMDCLIDLDRKINRRCQALPPSIALNQKEISELSVNAYGLHMQFRGIRIVLHRFIGKAVMRNPGRLHQPQEDGIERSRTIMHENATCIAQLASVYQQIFGIENVITVMLDNMFVAAAALTLHILRAEQDKIKHSTGQDSQWLRSLADMLYSAQKHYPVAARMRSTLAKVVTNSSLTGLFGTWPERRSSISGPVSSNQLHHNDISNGDQYPVGLSHYGQEHTSALQDPYGSDPTLISPEMDLNNMMSWILSPIE